MHRPPDLDSVRSGIRLIGERLAHCELRCDGIVNEPSAGILPRALRLEQMAEDAANGSIVLGTNPASAKGTGEYEYYMANGNDYASQLSYAVLKADHADRYTRGIKKFLICARLTGAILWTELVKCENQPGIKGVPDINTVRTCVSRYLSDELKLVPREWPIIAAGRTAFDFSALMFPSRTVLGIPHPSGSYGHFARLFLSGACLMPRVREMVTETLASSPRAEWLYQAL